MEKVLRKVNDKDPTITGWYLTDIGKIFYTTEFNHFFKNSLNLEKLYPEFWYEEVSVKKAFEDYYAIQDLHNFDERQLAKERYEKALNLIIPYRTSSTNIENCINGGIIEWEKLYKALKVAAGIEED